MTYCTARIIIRYLKSGGIRWKNTLDTTGRDKCMQNSSRKIQRQMTLGKGARGGAIGRDTALQTGRSRIRFPMVSLEFFIDIILPAAL
jgi:hypothetical protein